MESDTTSVLTFVSPIPDEFKLNLVERLMKNTREEFWEYIAKHPEMHTCLRSFLRRAHEQRPINIGEFAVEFFQTYGYKPNKNIDTHIEVKEGIL